MSGRFSRLRHLVRLVLASGLLLTIALGAVGQLVRDRSLVFGLMMYLPVVPLGIMAILIDAIFRGRALPRGRFVLGAVGLVAAVAASVPMIGFGPEPVGGTGQEISLLHWNVYWGGGRIANPAKLESIRREIVDRGADLIVLSESPWYTWLYELTENIGPGANWVELNNEPGATEWFKIVVVTKGPCRLIRREPIADGAGMVVEAEVRGRTIRLLAVDAKSNPLIPRTPRLLDIAGACRRAREMGKPIDVVVGDFNTPARSVGFDALEAEGYALASRSARGWRGTFPSFLPVYDIDHVWVRREYPVAGCELFTNFSSDHRGQVARFLVPE